ncbi:hypothetical protein LZG04_12140 [Saccharothrix sp. S26]|uniref:hypothetical protein n=1 Tax=Saccharothrix sp. S26 TaxID=2907215 RepID=UPI001F34229F|nr:hypothetical protein [Saccharothrix sp. S26]MCE6995545.1 hypothetical protein [Saccharothrix sp. S26]
MRTFASWTTTSPNGTDTAVVGSAGGAIGGAFTLSAPPAVPDYFETYDVHLQASSSTALIAYGAADAPPGRALSGFNNGSNPWVVSDPTGGIPGSIDSFGVAALTYHGGSRTTTLI